MANQPKKKLSGCAIVLMVFFFPYVLMYYIFKFLVRAPKDPPEKGGTNAVFAALTGAFFMIAGIGYVAAGFSGELQSNDPGDIVFGMVVMFLVCCGGGLALLIQSRKYAKLGKLNSKYIPCITGSGAVSIDEIAGIVGVSYETAVKDLELLLRKGALKGAYISHQTRSIVLPEEAQVPKKTVICPHCNGENLVAEGQNAVCDYCDMPLK